ncbi:MAG: BACON domain-containing protein [Rikenellaceae bacterium]
MAKLKTTVVESTEETTAAQAAASISTMSLVDESENTDQPVATITEDETGTEVVDPTPEAEPEPEPEIEPTLTLSVKTKSVSETAGSFNVNITSNSDWTSSNVPSWITLTPAQGSGDQAVKVAYTANAEYTKRSQAITFSVGDLTQTLTVTQSATPEPEPDPEPEPEGDEPDDFANQILKCFPKEELMYIDRQGGLYVQNTEEHIRKNAVLYTNPYFNQQ